jgi:hypothetical protein
VDYTFVAFFEDSWDCMVKKRAKPKVKAKMHVFCAKGMPKHGPGGRVQRYLKPIQLLSSIPRMP